MLKELKIQVGFVKTKFISASSFIYYIQHLSGDMACEIRIFFLYSFVYPGVTKRKKKQTEMIIKPLCQPIIFYSTTTLVQ